MTQVTLKTIEQNDNVGMFSICFDGNSESEFEKFLMEFKDNATYNKDFNAILLALSKIIDKGALERFFRIEGRMNDHVSALSIDSRKLRLYCLRISDQILILGNGGVKLSRTYQENEKLSGYVMDLQTFDKVLLKAQENGIITIEKNMITDIESATFGSQNTYKYHINIVNYSLIGLKYIKINGINLFKKKNTRNFAAAH